MTDIEDVAGLAEKIRRGTLDHANGGRMSFIMLDDRDDVDRILAVLDREPRLRSLLERAGEALLGVIRVADRATVEFDLARSVAREIEEATR